VADGLAMLSRGGDVILMKSEVPGTDDDLDARVLPVALDKDRGRHLAWSAGVGQLTETAWDAWPVLGPRTTRWMCRFIMDHEASPKAQFQRWKRDADLQGSELGVADYEFIMRVFEVALSYDNLNVSELASFELLARRVQLAAWRHRDRLVVRNAVDDLADDEYLYMGASETKGSVMVCPALSDHIGQALHKEATIAKDRRKILEARRDARGSGVPSHGGAGAAAGDKALQSKLDKAQSELKRLRESADKAGPGKGAGQPGKAGGQEK